MTYDQEEEDEEEQEDLNKEETTLLNDDAEMGATEKELKYSVLKQLYCPDEVESEDFIVVD